MLLSGVPLSTGERKVCGMAMKGKKRSEGRNYLGILAHINHSSACSSMSIHY